MRMAEECHALAAQAPADEQDRCLRSSRLASAVRCSSLSGPCRPLEQFLRLKQDLQAGRHIFLRTRLDPGKEPTLMSHGGREAKTGTHLIVARHARVGESASLGNEFLTDLLMPRIQLQQTSWAEMIRRPCLCTLPFSANPTAKQSPIVGIPAAPLKIEAVKAVADSACNRFVGINALDSKVKLVKLWKLSKI